MVSSDDGNKKRIERIPRDRSTAGILENVDEWELEEEWHFVGYPCLREDRIRLRAFEQVPSTRFARKK